MLLLITAAYAHPDLVPHSHTADAWTSAIVGFWLAVGFAFLMVVHKGLSRATTQQRAASLT